MDRIEEKRRDARRDEQARELRATWEAQVANQATLNATARVLGLPTVLDFLK